jgi:hypothetical protein
MVVPVVNHSNHSNVTMETNVRSFPKLHNGIYTVLLNNVREVSEFVLSRTSCYLRDLTFSLPMYMVILDPL